MSKLTLSKNGYNNLSFLDVLPNEDNFKDTRMTCQVSIPIIYKKKPTQYINFQMFILPDGIKNVEELLIDNIPKYLSPAQKKCFDKNGAVIYSLWSNRVS